MEHHEERQQQHLDELCRALSRIGPRACADRSSAALAHGLPVIELPPRPQLVVPRNASHLALPGLDIRRADVEPALVVVRGRLIPVTAPMETVFACGRTLPFDEAVAVADAYAWRSPRRLRELRTAAAHLTGRGAPAARLVCGWAHTLAGSPMESLARVCLRRGGIGPLTLQWRLHPESHPYDLRVGRGADLLIETDGDEHRGRDRFEADLDAGIEAVVGGQALLRLGWRHVRYQQTRLLVVVRRLAAERRATVRQRRRTW